MKNHKESLEQRMQRIGVLAETSALKPSKQAKEIANKKGILAFNGPLKTLQAIPMAPNTKKLS